ncbi:MAG: DUF3137 domain-containing protein [Sulfurospirillaceae bacterium]|nr:DUF3137 domain-containing protein [Sulfurospirillaceae bacterium]MDD2825290.1 DUF3137 domain-containing protein [Sulfurospirillaceae bacterium]
MQTNVSSLMDFFYEKMYGDLKILEQDRLAIVAKLQKTAIILSLVGVMVFFILTRSFPLTFLQAFALVGTLLFLIYMFIYRHLSSGYRLLFKEEVIAKIVQFIDPSLLYQANKHISEKEYTTSELFSENFDRLSGNDLVQGTINGVNLKFSDLHVEKQMKDKEGREHWESIFQGLFFIVDFNKHFTYKTVVLPEIASNTFGILGEWIQEFNKSHGELVKLDNPAFEKLFVVYGNQIESRYILSPSMMERILDFKAKTGKVLSISFIPSKMYLCVDYKKDLFEPILTQSLLDFAPIKEYFKLLSLILGIVEAFKLDEKIWSKR